MATILLAIGDRALREACRVQLEAAGQAVIHLDRPLAPLSLARSVEWDVALVDASELGRQALQTFQALASSDAALVGLGLDDARLRASIPLPLVAKRLLATLQELAGVEEAENGALELDADTRSARCNGREVSLTRTEFRMVEVLSAQNGVEVSQETLLQAVWGSSEGRGASELVRAHVRNLRAKLAQIGLPDAIRSRRGHGYALVV